MVMCAVSIAAGCVYRFGALLWFSIERAQTCALPRARASDVRCVGATAALHTEGELMKSICATQIRVVGALLYRHLTV